MMMSARLHRTQRGIKSRGRNRWKRNLSLLGLRYEE